MDNEKFVEFDKYCNKCVNMDEPESFEVCDECLSVPAKEFSHKPINYKEKK